jgi:malate dehydrogenase
MRKKVTIVGAGMTGGSMAQRLFEKGYCDIVLQDIVEGLPQGKALDIAESGPVLGVDSRITGTNGWDETADSDVVVITSGVPRKPGMTREDLINTNAGIVRSVIEKAVAASPNATYIIFANPMDAMCHVALKASGLPRERVVGQGGLLDSTRYRTFIAWEFNASVKDVHAWVLGGHTEATMVPIVSRSSVAGVPLREIGSPEQIQRLVERTRNGGAEIVSYLKTGSAYTAPSAAAVAMVEAVLLDQKRVVPCACYLQGEYGIHDAYVGVLARLGAGGVEAIIEMPIDEDELHGLNKAAEAVRELAAIAG